MALKTGQSGGHAPARPPACTPAVLVAVRRFGGRKTVPETARVIHCVGFW